MLKKYHIITYGCEMNESDSERIAAVAEQMGYYKTSSYLKADLVVINSCSVRQAAIDKVYSKAKALDNLRKKRKITAVVTGCVLEKDRKEFGKRFNLLFNIKKLEELPILLQKINPKAGIFSNTPLLNQIGSRQKGKLSLEEESYLKIAPSRTNKFSALIPVSNGCNKFCSFCAVPYVRGMEINRPAKDIISEAEKCVKEGAKEIVLLGQTVNSYKDKDGITFDRILRQINEIPGKFWIRFVSPYPTHFTDEIIMAMVECGNVNKYTNLPLQSGDNNTLKRMNRRYTVEQYKKIVLKLRAKMPDIGICTDIIVGFCSETEEEFQHTAEIMKEIKYDMAYIARYSPRPGTFAQRYLKDNVPNQEKKRRHKILTEILKSTAQERSQRYKGKILEVLFTEIRRKYLYGRTDTMKNVVVAVASKDAKKLIGNFSRVKIKNVFPFVMEGKII